MKRVMTGIAGMVLLVGTGFALEGQIQDKPSADMVYSLIAIETPDGTKAHAVMSKDQYDKIKDKDLKGGVNVKLVILPAENGMIDTRGGAAADSNLGYER
ncbi:hypothetical protein [Legionella impletisoli]|uniref:Uncharacterized protein n=1 Tax=Legionella impletisoli TaxID=343510 RepID=A0A917JQG8_9GAMM|nr:hypothetical protein [Legionella impletisoli]GGI81787.1 hypothetical protein GCM10007966_07920 [Legionella impletisoli]